MAPKAPEYSSEYVEQAIKDGTEWQLFAACREADADLFSPPDGWQEAASYRKRRVAQALAYCTVCPVKLVCGDEAIAAGEMHTIRGGMTEKELTLIQENKIRRENTQIARRRVS